MAPLVDVAAAPRVALAGVPEKARLPNFAAPVEEAIEGLCTLVLDAGSIVATRLVGEGATSQVFEGTWHGLPVAIKEMRLARRRMLPKVATALSRELAVLQSMSHPHVMQLYGVVLGRQARIVTELCRGGCVFDLLHTSPNIRLAWWQKMQMCVDTADAMRYLHSFDPPIIHRDMKSMNLLLATPVLSEEDMPIVKLSDFGLSRVKGLTAAGFMTNNVGTSLWMAPELNGHRAYDEKIDVYSFAMLLFEVVFRAIPFGDVAGMLGCTGLAELVGRGERPSLAACPCGCPPMLVSLIKMCWHHIPELRPDFPHILKYLDIIRGESKPPQSP